jgi:hypothetical protein
MKFEEKSKRFLDTFENVEQVRGFVYLLFVSSFHSPCSYFTISFTSRSICQSAHFCSFQAQELTLQTHLTSMRMHVQEAGKHLALTHTARQGLLDRAGSLREERYGFFVF